MYTYFFEQENTVVKVEFMFDGMTLDDIESLSKCGSLARRQWASTLMKVIIPGENMVKLTDQNIFAQNPFRKILELESWNEGLVLLTRIENKITIHVRRISVIFINCI